MQVETTMIIYDVSLSRGTLSNDYSVQLLQKYISWVLKFPSYLSGLRGVSTRTGAVGAWQ